MYQSSIYYTVSLFLLSVVFFFNGQSQCPENCFIPCDSTFQAADLTGFGSFDCDDCSTNEIQIPFDYSICGTVYNSLWINSNGNVTFGGPYAVFTPVGIPNNITAIMAAPFWADVDFSNGSSTCGNLCYRIDSNKMIINWEEVGYFAGSCYALNTFQLIISDGTDSLIGLGNNTAFNYKDMNWTTGGASGGSGGFGGSDATVGINANDNLEFGLIGQFNFPGNQTPVLDSLGYSLSAGEVDWLDNKCFTFDASQCIIEFNQDNFVSAGDIFVDENFYSQDSVFNLEACGYSDQLPVIDSTTAVAYLLTNNSDSTIMQLSDDTCFDIDQFGNYGTFVIIYDSLLYDINSVVLNSTTLTDVLVFLNDSSICYNISEGDDFLVSYCNLNDGSIATGELSLASDSIYLNTNDTTICPNSVTPSIVPEGFQELFILSSNDTLLESSSTACFTLNTTGNYAIHSLVYHPDDFSFSINLPSITTVNDMTLYFSNFASNCFELDIMELSFQVLDCQALTTNLSEPLDSILVGDTLCLQIYSSGTFPANFVDLYFLVKNDTVIDIFSANCLEMPDTGNYLIYSLIIHLTDVNSIFTAGFQHPLDQFSDALGILNNCYSFNEIGMPFNAYETVTNVQELENSLDILFYPNPIQDNLFIDFKGQEIDGLRIYNAEGRIVANFNQNLSGIRTFNLKHFEAGIYFLEIMKGNKLSQKKIIVE